MSGQKDEKGQSGDVEEPEVIQVDSPLQPWQGSARDYRPRLSNEFKQRQKHARDKILLEIQKYQGETPGKKRITIRITPKGHQKKMLQELAKSYDEEIAEKDFANMAGRFSNEASYGDLASSREVDEARIAELQIRHTQEQKRWARENDSLKTEIQKLQGSQIALESQLQIHNHRIDEITSQYREEIKNLTEKNAQQREKYQELERQLEYEKKKRQALHQVLSRNIQENFEDVEKVVEVDRERHILLRRLEAYEEEKQLLESEKGHLHKKLQEVKRESKEQSQKLQEEKNRSLQQQREVEYLRNELEQLRMNNEQLRQQKKELEDRVRIYGQMKGTFVVGDEIAGSYDSYRIVEPFKSGGMGDLFLAKRISNNEQVVIKTLQASPEGDENKKLLRFIQEARMLLKFDHPNIVRGLDFQQTPRCTFLVMEYLEGLTLEQIFSQIGIMEERRAARIVLQIARSLQCLEKMGVVHRDIKPSNILITNENAVKLMDFGILKLFRTKCILTTSGIIMGTPYYISPEQITDTEVSIKSDIYSLGVTFYQMVVGDVPFSGDNHVEVIAQRLTKTPPRASKTNTSLHKSLDALIDQMMDKKNIKRPSPTEVVEQLEAFLAESPSQRPLD